MATNTPLAPLPEQEARDVLNNWSNRGLFRLRNMGEKVFIQQIEPCWAYTVRLQTRSRPGRSKFAGRHHGPPAVRL
jgi:hypothetical protein